MTVGLNLFYPDDQRIILCKNCNSSDVDMKVRSASDRVWPLHWIECHSCHHQEYTIDTLRRYTKQVKATKLGKNVPQ